MLRVQETIRNVKKGNVCESFQIFHTYVQTNFNAQLIIELTIKSVHFIFSVVDLNMNLAINVFWEQSLGSLWTHLKGTLVYWRSYKYAVCLCSNIIRGPLSCRLIHLHLINMVLPSFISLFNLLIVFSLATVLIMADSLPDRENIFLLVRCIIQFFSLWVSKLKLWTTTFAEG